MTENASDTARLTEHYDGRSLARIVAGVAIWLGISLSLGWYYTFTYYGRTGIPMPTFEPCAALILYYFSVLNVSTVIQAVHWVVVFPVAGILWAQALRSAARFRKLQTPPFSCVFYGMSLAALPLALPAPWMSWVAGDKPGEGFALARMLHVALRREEQLPWTALTPMYLALGILALVLQIYMYRRLYKQSLGPSLSHYFLSAVVLSAAAAILGSAAGIPLRLLLE